jgi:sporulation protein YlmC with PRC-barrel domain
MARYGTLGDYRFSDTQEAAADIRGTDVYGPDNKKLGTIDDVIFDEATGAIVYVVVDTGGWLSNKMFIVPPEQIRPSMQHDGDFLVDLTKEQIERLPPYDGGTLTDEEKWADYERRYRSKWAEGPVMHREGTDRNITPTTKQQLDAGSGTIPTSEADFQELDNKTEVVPVHPQVEMDISPNTPSYRWTTFEDTLRRRREEVLQSSIDNAKRATRASSNDASERKPSDRRRAS